ncbi:hypothetical protein PN36_17705 [Candidatus Thiomargarita nelsonii]|uniref:Uncharacterized protein n=1 Tax=Candidatus Thiomargarita nelsonii TaxID=1003181 RepID=A0A0A6PH58_9GAMM|nr:hypothetical protein PN36_17705 [Candidatus Thiomargarita nelsonii]
MKNINKFFLIKIILIIFCLALAIFTAYHNALNNAFVASWDTGYYVIGNPNIKAFNWENIQWMFTHFYMANWHPLTWLSHALDYAWFGLEPWGHHLVSLIIHGFNTVLLFVLVIVLMSSANKSFNNQTLLAAGCAAILFGIHPQHVESVVWIAERKDVLSLFFILLALLSYVFYNTSRHLSWYLSALFCFVLALLAKPMAVTFPVILILMDVYPLNRTVLTASAQPDKLSLLIIEKIPFFIFTLFSIIITLVAQEQGGALASIQGLSIEMRLLNAFNSLIFYITKFIFPLGLSPYYPFPSTLDLIPVITCFFITFLCGYSWYKKKYYWLITWLFYLVTLSPVIGIIQVGGQAAADRYVYLPTIPFYILLGIGIAKLLYAGKLLKLGTLISFLLLSVVLVQLTQKQSLVWKNDVIFWNYTVAYTPTTPSVQFYLGNAYLKEGKYEKAIVHYHLALSLEPRNKWWYENLSIAYIKLNRLEEALALLKQLIELKTEVDYSWDNIYYMIGWIYFKQGLLEPAQDSLTKALEINPENKGARELLVKIPLTGSKATRK